MPYARLVPLHARDRLEVKDHQLTGTGGRTYAYEYDGLQSGELAWVLGKCFPVETTGLSGLPTLPTSAIEFAAYMTNARPHDNRTDTDGSLLRKDGAFAGFGVDRMQRLAYTNWVEAYFEKCVGRQIIDLMDQHLGDNASCELDSELNRYKYFLQNVGLFCVPDLAYMYADGVAMNRAVDMPINQGLFILETGPFLRSIGAEAGDPVDLLVPTQKAGSWRLERHAGAPRHLGSDLAQRGLYAALKKVGVFNWVPDGIVLSKLETGPNPQADAEMDARMSQLFNLAIQGPAITKTWCGNYRLQAQPMDKVFILVVGDLSYSLIEKGDRDRVKKVREFTMHQRAWTSDAENNFLPDGNLKAAFAGEIETERNKIPAIAAIPGETAYTNKYKYFVTAMVEYEKARLGRDNAEIERKRGVAKGAFTEFQEQIGVGDSENAVNIREGVFSDVFQAAQLNMRSGQIEPKKVELTNLRLMRATSSYLTNYSRLKKNDDHSRLGLGIGYDDTRRGGAASYVLGGWCIGTVLDSAASRATVNGTMRSNPASMAMNVNVNVEWWDANKLHQHYNDATAFDDGSTVRSRADPRNAEGKTVAVTAKLDEVADKAFKNEESRGEEVYNYTHRVITRKATGDPNTGATQAKNDWVAEVSGKQTEIETRAKNLALLDPKSMNEGGNYVRERLLGPDNDGPQARWDA